MSKARALSMVGASPYRPLTGDERQQVLDTQAVPGDEVVRDATRSDRRSTDQPIELPARTNSAGAWIVIRSDQAGAAGFPAAGNRVEHSRRALMPNSLVPANDVPALRTRAGASRCWLIGVQFYAATGVTEVGDIVQLGSGSRAPEESTR